MGSPSSCNSDRPWTAHEKSDLDIAVLFDRRPPGLDERSEIVHEIQGLFPKREIDLAVINHADPLFLKQVLERCRLLAGSPRRLAELKIYARHTKGPRILAERYLERIIGRMIDINYHVLTESGQPPPPDCYQSFTALATIGMLDQAFAKRIAGPRGTTPTSTRRSTPRACMRRYSPPRGTFPNI